MHEVGIMQNVLELAEEQAKASGAARIHEIRLRIGSMAGVVRESLEYAFEVLRAQTLAAGARLTIDEVPAACWCRECQAEFEAAELLCECPRCGALSSELRRGRELELSRLEVS